MKPLFDSLRAFWQEHGAAILHNVEMLNMISDGWLLRGVKLFLITLPLAMLVAVLSLWESTSYLVETLRACGRGLGMAFAACLLMALRNLYRFRGGGR